MPAPGSHVARHSRESYELLKRMGMTRVPAKLGECFRKPECWEALSVLGFGQELSPNSTGLSGAPQTLSKRDHAHMCREVRPFL